MANHNIISMILETKHYVSKLDIAKAELSSECILNDFKMFKKLNKYRDYSRKAKTVKINTYKENYF